MESYKPRDMVFGHPNTIDLRKKKMKTLDDPCNYPFKLTHHNRKISTILNPDTDKNLY